MPFEWIFIALYFSVLAVLCTYGLHRLHLVIMCWRYRDNIEQVSQMPSAEGDDLPHVTVQLPLYNEATVVRRLLDAAAGLDYPHDRLQIQVLDDSSDETQSIAQARVDELRADGLDIEYVRRPDRVGYKAGALEYGMQTAKGSLIAIFDADFVPQPEFLRSIVGHFEDPEIAVVQTRWGHMNREHSGLTAVQALMLDGHHLVENRARYGAGCYFNFSGTGGMWRAEAITDAGGWQHDTLTEDLDLSYRAQMRGWKFVYRPDVATPSELPESLAAFRAQQFRWSKGTVQTARKLLGRVLRSRELSVFHRIEAFFHLTPHFAYPLMVALAVLILPALLVMPAVDTATMILIDLPLALGSTGSLATFYCLAERAQGRSAFSALRRLPAVIAVGCGMSPHLTRAVFSGLTSMSGEFVRTPKRGSVLGRYRQAASLPYAEIGLTLISCASSGAALATGHWVAFPFTCLFASGFGYVAWTITSEEIGRRRAVARDTDEAVTADPPRIAGHA